MVVSGATFVMTGDHPVTAGQSTDCLPAIATPYWKRRSKSQSQSDDWSL